MIFTKIIWRIISGRLKIKFGNPEQSQVLILDSATGWIFNSILKEIHSISTFESRFLRYDGKVIPLSFRIIGNIFRFRFLGLNLYDSYVSAVIRATRCKSVLDRGHSLNLFDIANHFPEVRFYMVQNGSWLKSVNPSIEPPRFVQMLEKRKFEIPENLRILCFGKNDVDKSLESEFSKEKLHRSFSAIGSLVSGYYLENVQTKQENDECKWSICLVSQAVPARIRKGGRMGESRFKAYQLINQHLDQYTLQTGKKAVVSTRLSEGDDDFDEEYEFFQTYFENNPNVDVPIKRNRFDSYRNIMASDLVLSLYSSMGFESIGMGKKAMFFPYYHESIFKFSANRFNNDKDIWRWIEYRTNYELFHEKLNLLISLDHESYLSQEKNRMDYICASTNDNNPINLFVNLLSLG